MRNKSKMMMLCVAVGMFALMAAACHTPGDNGGGANTNATAIGANRSGSASNTNAAPGASNTGPLSEGDKEFMMKAAVSGMAEVELGRMAAQKAVNSDVKTFGKRMVDDHSKANDELKQLALQKSVTLPTDLDAKHKETMDRLSKLNGAAFDNAYVSEMVKDHTAAVLDFERESNEGQNSDAKAWAAKTLPTLRSHLEMIQGIESTLRGGKPANRNAGNSNNRR
jgi:putative membrane protein